MDARKRRLMKAPGPRSSFYLLVVLTALSWAIPIWEATQYHMVSVISAVTAGMFTAMLVAWPFLTGTRVAKSGVQHANMCVECRSLRWPAEAALGFCLHCGSMRPPVRAGY